TLVRYSLPGANIRPRRDDHARPPIAIAVETECCSATCYYRDGWPHPPALEQFAANRFDDHSSAPFSTVDSVASHSKTRVATLCLYWRAPDRGNSLSPYGHPRERRQLPRQRIAIVVPQRILFARDSQRKRNVYSGTSA